MMNAHDFGQGAQSKQTGKGPSQRQLRVGEEIRHALSDALLRGETHHPDLIDASVTISEVRISPDLRNATAYVAPLAGARKEAVLKALGESAGELRHIIGKRLVLRNTPRLSFRLDDSFEKAHRINELLQSDAVRKDVTKAE